MRKPFQRQMRFLLRSVLTAMFAGGAVAGATDFDLSLTKQADVTTLTAGGTINFTIKVSNAGPYAATNVVVNDMLPKGFKFVSATPAVSRVDTTSDPRIAQYFFNLGTINAGSSKTIVVKATGVAPSAITAPSIDSHYDYKNIAEVYSVDYASYDPDSRPNNCDYNTVAAGYSLQDDCAYVRVPVTAPVGTAQLSLAKTSNGPWTVGQSDATYTLNVANTGSSSTSGTITVTDQLPAGITLGSASLPAGWTASSNGQTVTLTSNNVLAVGSSVNLTLPVNVTSSAGSSVTNRAVVAGGGDPDAAPSVTTCTPGNTSPSNQCATVTTTIAAAPPTPVACTNLYSLVLTSTSNDSYGNVIYYNGGKIQRLDETTNTLVGSAITLPNGATSATLTVSPDGSKFFTADDKNNLLIYNVSTGSWTTAGVFSGVSDRLVRMGMTPSGTGYAMDSNGYMWSFTQSGNPVSLGRLSATSSTAPNFYQNGDFFSTQDGKLYMLSAQTGGKVNLWFVDPVAKTAEYLGDLTNASGQVQYNGLAATPNGIFADTTAGNLSRVDPVAVTITPVGGASTGSTDLASCYYPTYAPKIDAVKTVKKVAGSSGTDVRPGDTLEYTITVRNSGNLPAGGSLLRDALPAGTTYVPGSAKVNGFGSTNTAGNPTVLTGSAYPFATSVGICSTSTTACTNQVLKVDTTPGVIDNEAVITFRVTVNDGVTSVKNRAVINYNDGTTPPTDIPTNTTDTPVVPWPQLTIAKTSNATSGSWALGQGPYTYTLTVTNSSSVATSGTITVKDQLPAGVTPVNGSFNPANGWSCTTSGQLVTCTSTSVLAAGANNALTIPVNIFADAQGSITNKATVGGGGDPDAIPDPATCTPGSSNPGNQCASVTVTVTGSTTPAQCTNLYGLVMAPGAAAYPAYGRTIQLIGDTNNVLGSTVATLPNNQTGAALGVSPDGKKFFVAADSTSGTSPLLVYDTTTAQWTTGGSFASGTERMVRMTVASNGTGYAMDSAGNLYSFTTSAPYSVTKLGPVTSNSSNAPTLSWNGDMFASDKGLYMLSSVEGTATIDLWLVNPATRNAEYLGRLSDPGQSNSQYNGFAATPNGVFGRDNYGRLVKIDLNNVTLTSVGAPTTGSTDLASCYYPTFAPNLNVTKTVKKVGGSTGTTVLPGDTLEYTITVRNSGNVPAGGVTLQDALPAGTTYVADSARINGATTTVTAGSPTDLAGAAYPFASPVGICSTTGNGAACTTQVLKIDTTPTAIDNEAVITFRVKVNDPFTQTPSQVSNQAVVKYTDGPDGGVPSDDPGTTPPGDPTVTPVIKPVKLVVEKTVQNITAKTDVGTSVTGKPGDVLEYCIKTSNLGSAYASNITFGDTVPTNTSFLLGGYGAARDILVKTSTSADTYYTAAQDTDAGALVNNRVTVNGGTFILQPQQTFTVCFRTTIK